MKILHSHSELKAGGIQAMIIALSNEMCKRHMVEFLSIFEPLDSHLFLNKLDKRINITSTHKKKNGFELSVLWRIYKVMKKGRYDVVNIHGMFYYYIFAILILHSKIKFFYTIHSEADKEDYGWDKKVHKIRKIFFKWGWIRPITISKKSDKSFSDYYGVPGHLIYNGTSVANPQPLDLCQYRRSPKTKVLVNVGRICEPKNQVMLCEVCDRLIKEGFDITLLIVGPNESETIYKKMMHYFSDRIIHIGESNRVADIMNAADAFCLSSKWEGLPVTLLEAMSVGCVPVCTPVGGMPEVIVNRGNGFLADSPSGEDYYVALKEYLNTREDDLSRIKSEWIHTFNNFNIKNTALTYEFYYKNVR